MQVRYRVTLSEDERQYLQGIKSRGVHRSRKLINALILPPATEVITRRIKARTKK